MIIMNNGAMGMDIYDIIIIGGGAAGMSAAIYAVRGGMKTLVLERLAIGGQAAKTYEIDNYPGFYNTPSGPDLMADFKKHAEKLGVLIRTEAVRDIINIDGDIKTVKTRRGEYNTKTVIFALGASPKKLGAKGEAELTGAGVSYCATCDGAFFKDKVVGVVGGGNSALQEAVLLSDLCEKVYVFQNLAFLTGEKKLVDILSNKDNVEFVLEATVAELKGDSELTGVILNTAQGEKEVSLDGLFVAIGLEPKNSAFAETAALDKNGYFDSDESCVTKTEGIFVAGDCRQKSIRQITTASADGAVAALAACRYIDNK